MSISSVLNQTICSLSERCWLSGVCLLCAAPARDTLCAACLAELPEQQPAYEVLGGDSKSRPLQGRLFAATFERSEQAREEATRERPAGYAPHPTAPEAGHAGITALSLWRYVEPADRVVLGFKYGGHATVARLWAERVADRLPAVDAIVAMPMHRTRLAERGENPADVMAAALRPRLPGRPMLVRATKTRVTAHQQGLDRDGRLANVAGAYRIDADLRGRRVLLVDDVLTTGASFLALTAAARAAGAGAVSAVAMARAAP